MFKPAIIGASIGLADGLAFVISAHVGVSYLADYLLIPSLPCVYVVCWLDWQFPSIPEWIAWTGGVLVMGLIGALIGLMLRLWSSAFSGFRFALVVSSVAWSSGVKAFFESTPLRRVQA